MARSGARWRDLPERFGAYQPVKRRYYDWVARGVLAAIIEALSAEADLEWGVYRRHRDPRHQHAAGARQEKGGLMPRGWAARAAA